MLPHISDIIKSGSFPLIFMMWTLQDNGVKKMGTWYTWPLVALCVASLAHGCVSTFTGKSMMAGARSSASIKYVNNYNTFSDSLYTGVYYPDTSITKRPQIYME